MKIASRVTKMQPSLTLAVSAKADQAEGAGGRRHRFGVGEPDFDTPDHIKDAAVAALKKGCGKYTAVGGTAELRAAAAAELNAAHGTKHAAENIIVSVGAKHSLFNLFMALLDDGDEVIVPSPCWVSYPEIVVDGRRQAGPRRHRARRRLPAPLRAAGARGDAEDARHRPQLAVQPDRRRLRRELDAGGRRACCARTPSCSSSPTTSIAAWSTASPWLSLCARRRPSVADAYHPRRRRVEDLRDDRLAHRLHRRARRARQGDGHAAGPVDHQPRRRSRRRRRWRPDRPAGLGRRDARRVRQAAPRHGRRAARDPEGQAARAARRVLLLPRPRAPTSAARSRTTSRCAEWLLEKGRVAVVPGSGFFAPGFVRLSYATSMANVNEGVKRIGEALAQL